MCVLTSTCEVGVRHRDPLKHFPLVSEVKWYQVKERHDQRVKREG